MKRINKYLSEELCNSRQHLHISLSHTHTHFPRFPGRKNTFIRIQEVCFCQNGMLTLLLGLSDVLSNPQWLDLHQHFEGWCSSRSHTCTLIKIHCHPNRAYYKFRKARLDMTKRLAPQSFIFPCVGNLCNN